METKILIIDNHLLGALNLQRLLHTKGYNVVQVADVEKGLAKARETYPDMIVLCLDTLNQTLLQACSKFKTEPSLRTRPLIVRCDRTDLQTMLEIYKLGADYYFSKDQSNYALVELIEKLNWTHPDEEYSVSRPAGWRQLVARLTNDTRNFSNSLTMGLRTATLSRTYQLLYKVDGANYDIDLQVASNSADQFDIVGQVLGGLPLEQWASLVALNGEATRSVRADETDTFRFQDVSAGKYFLVLQNEQETVALDFLKL